jgi:hypothetical protein
MGWVSNFISLSDGRFVCDDTFGYGNNVNNSLTLWSLDSSGQQYLSTTFAAKVHLHDISMSSVFQQHGHGRPFSSEGILIYNGVYQLGINGSPLKVVPERISLWSFPSVQKRRWLRRRGFLLLVHCSHRAVRTNVNSSNCLASSHAFQKLIRIDSLVMVITKLL